jgi:hypothetical protein
MAVFTVWDCGVNGQPVAIGGTSIHLFAGNASVQKMVKGKKKLYLWPRQQGDGQEPSSTPWDAAQLDESDRLEKLLVIYCAVPIHMTAHPQP